MSKIVILLALVVIAGAGWYLWNMGTFEQFLGNSEEGATQENMEEESTTENTVTVQLAEQNASGQSGTATLSEVNGQVRVVLSVTGAPAGVAQPAHIHTSSCATIGGVQYPLNSPINGQSETMLDISMADIESGLPLSINVHKSAEEVGVYVACGNIVL